jgi:hypothetical protein
MTPDAWESDLNHMEEVIQEIGMEGETFRIGDMFPSIMEDINKMERGYKKPSSEDDFKNSLRIVFIVVLHLCIFSQSNHVVEDIKQFWNVYDNITNGTRNNANHNEADVYCAVFHDMFQFMIASQKETEVCKIGC